MENERFKKLRNMLGLSQEEMAARLGLSKSGISNIEKGKRTLIDRNVKLLCSEFNVNEAWLRTGDGEMFIQSDATLIDQVAHEYALDDLDKKILAGYLELPAQHRQILKSYLLNLAESVNPPHPVAFPADPIEEEIESYRKELEAERMGSTSSHSAG